MILYTHSEIKTNRLVLKILEEKRDLESIFQITKKYPEISEFMTWEPPKDIEEAREKFFHPKDKSRDAPDLHFGIFFNDTLIGRISVRNFHFFQQDAQKKSVFLSFWVSPEFSGKGFATEVLEGICRFVFRDLGMNKIFAGVFAANIASQKVLEKVGFRKIGVLRKHYCKNGIWIDSTRFELLEQAFL